MSFHPLRRGLRGVGQFLTFTYQEPLVWGSLTKFKAVSIPQEIGTPELEFRSSS
jgi:hypothetical protein